MKLIRLCNVNKTYYHISLIKKLCCYLMLILIFDYELKKF